MIYIHTTIYGTYTYFFFKVIYIHSFKVGRVGDEELFDVIQLTSLLLSLGLKPKRSVAPQESGSLTLRIFLCGASHG